MAKARLSMRKIKEVLRLTYQCGLSRRQVAHSCQVSRSTVADYLYRGEKAGISCRRPKVSPIRSLSKGCLCVRRPHRFLSSRCRTLTTCTRSSKSTKSSIRTVTSTPSFVSTIGARVTSSITACTRTTEEEKNCSVDYGAGLTLVDPKGGELISTELFVAVWGASNYTYAEATLTQ